MSEICKKYGLQETQFKAMVKDGVISTTWPFYDEIIIFYKQNKHKGNSEAVKLASEKYGVSIQSIYNIIKKV